VTASEDAEQVVRQVLERLDPDDYEIVTIYSGQDVTAEQAEALAETVRTLYPQWKSKCWMAARRITIT
jgi:dihydroxyacetone kinase-like predicted kinase